MRTTLQHWSIRLLLGVIVLLTSLGACMIFFLMPSSSVHGTSKPLLFEGGPSILIGTLLLSIAALSSVGVLVLYFRRQQTWRRAVIAALGSILAFLLLVFGIGWVVVSITAARP